MPDAEALKIEKVFKIAVNEIMKLDLIVKEEEGEIMVVISRK